jgi:hypothetical protein
MSGGKNKAMKLRGGKSQAQLILSLSLLLCVASPAVAQVKTIASSGISANDVALKIEIDGTRYPKGER